MPERLKQNIIPLVLFIGIFSLYLSTASPVATNYADSNELITASYTLGIPHPPGYPLFVLIGKLFSFIPIGEIAFRYAIMSSFFGALTVVLVYLTLLKIFSNGKSQAPNSKSQISTKLQIPNSKHLIYAIVPALVGALSLAFSYLFWLYSIVPEVFVLTNFFTALIIFLGISWYYSKKIPNDKIQIPNKSQNPNSKFKTKWQKFRQSPDYYPVLIALASGLGFLAHQIVAFLAPALIFLIWITDPKLFVPTKRWLKVFGALAIGLLPLLYFPIISHVSNPVIDFGNVKSFGAFWDLITRKLYANAEGVSNAYAPKSISIAGRLGDLPNYRAALAESFSWPLFSLGILGLVYFFYLLAAKKLKNIKNFIGISYLFTGIVFAMYTWLDPSKRSTAGYNLLGVHERMYLMGMIAFAILAGIGAYVLLRLIKKSKFFSAPIIALVLLGLTFNAFQANYVRADKSDFYLGEDYAYNLFVNIEEDAIFFVRGDMPSFAAFYYKFVKGERRDVTVIPLSLPEWKQRDILEQHPELWDVDSGKLELIIRDIIADNIDKRPIYFTGLPADEISLLGLAETPYVLSPRGPIQKVTKEFDPQPDKDWWEPLRFRNPDEADEYFDWFAKEILEQYIIGHFNSMSWYLRYGYNDLAGEELDEMRRIDPRHDTTERALYRFGQERRSERVEKIPERDDAQLHREAVGFIRQGSPLGALGNYLYLTEKNPDNIDYKMSLAKIFAGLGWRDEAEKELNKILEIEPEHKEAKLMMRQWELIK